MPTPVGTNEPRDPNRVRQIDDSEALATIGALLGTRPEWNGGDLCTAIADLIAETGRLHPGDDQNTPAWRAFARERGMEVG